MAKTEVFLDTAYAITLASSSNEHHEQAMLLADQLESNATRLVTTRAIMVEIGDALSKQPYRQAAVELLQSLEQDPCVEIVPLTEALYQAALELYRQRQDKEWGITDCVPFVVMNERNLQEALTTDRHFQQAGYQALLRQ